MSNSDAVRALAAAILERQQQQPALGWGPQQPALPPEPQIAGPYDLMPARTPQEQALRDLIFANPRR